MWVEWQHLACAISLSFQLYVTYPLGYAAGAVSGEGIAFAGELVVLLTCAMVCSQLVIVCPSVNSKWCMGVSGVEVIILMRLYTGAVVCSIVDMRLL